ncbi:hypothetical protein [Halalkalibacterium ligniniphilum]|uniref:hypothetical protein n=1 Tax=Halalkalibacterium ligniniphilum TaxID=1134413 RepID=UPI00034C1EB5|nr:hypothetical protein [Halalkalibacterium ligniniphilum]
MERYVNVMKQSIELVETMEEGVGYIHTQLNEGRFEQSVLLFEDVLNAYAIVEQSTSSVLAKMEEQSVLLQLEKGKQALERILSTYEEKQHEVVKEIIQFTLLPAIHTLKKELEQSFSSYLVS